MKTVLERFAEKVTLSAGCWDWTGAKTPEGYGQIHWGGNVKYAHRVMYGLLRGDVRPPYIDHLCRNTSCVNPNHLEAVTCRVNVLRGVGVVAKNAAKTHCKRGHAFDEKNTYKWPTKYGSGRSCRACGAARKRKEI